MKYIFPGPSFEGLNFVMGFFDTTFSYGQPSKLFCFLVRPSQCVLYMENAIHMDVTYGERCKIQS